MREIIFRGKRLDNGEWCEGAFLNDRDGSFYICPAASDITYGDNGNRRRIGCWFKVNPSTVGQYTGLKDKNGMRIFEGDIIIFNNDINKTKWRVVFGMNYGYGINSPCFMLKDFRNAASAFNEEEMVIIGNIHDNTELLEEQNA